MKKIAGAFRRYFIAGLAALFPVAVTVYLVVWIFQFADGLLGRILPVRVPGLGLLLTIGIIFLVGVFSSLFGRVIFRTLEVWFSRLPLIKHIYPAAKRLAQFLFTDNGGRAVFRRVVFVEYPSAGIYSLAFVTAETLTSATGPSENLLTLLIPNPPSPFTGPIVFVPKEDVIPLDMSVEDAVKLIVSGGVISSPLKAESSK